MKQKGQAKQNTKKELKETPNWTSSAKTVAPDAPVTQHRSNRLASDTPVQCPGHVKRSKVSPDAPVMSKGSIGATTMLLLREHVKWPASKPSGPDTPVPHRSKAPVQYQGGWGENVHDPLNWCTTVQLTGLSGGLLGGPTAKSEPWVTGYTGALPPVYPVL